MPTSRLRRFLQLIYRICVVISLIALVGTVTLWILCYTTTFWILNHSTHVREPSIQTSNYQCRECGYDLRATPGRCPECGTIVEERIRDTSFQPVRESPDNQTM